jgi:DNA-directed RNA polymerase subunit RPC12/RpoP
MHLCMNCGVFVSEKDLKKSGGALCLPCVDQVIDSCFPTYERKEVLMKHCSMCQRELPARSTPDSGVEYHEEVLCGTCLKAAQKVCPHSLKKDDGITCRDCGARPVTVGRVFRGAGRGISTVVKGFVKLFMIYTVPSIVGSLVTGGLLYLLGKKIGILP